MANTEKYNLYITDDGNETFQNWRRKIAGLTDSNMIKIDAALKELDEKQISGEMLSDIIIMSDIQPDSDINRVWIKNDAEEIELVTIDDLDSYAEKNHTHGSISSDGLVVDSRNIASGDMLLIADYSEQWKAVRSVTFDGTTTTKALTQKGTWETFNNYSHPTSTYTAAAAVKVGRDALGHVILGGVLTAADVGAMTEEQVATAIQNAIGNAIGGSY